MTHSIAATKLREAKKNHTPVAQLTKEWPELKAEDAYQIQSALLELSVAEGDVLCGYKMGLTSKAKQKDVGVDETIHGFLLESYEVHKGGTIDVSTKIHPRVEPEIAVVLKTRLFGKFVTLREVIAAIDCVVPACEIIDSRYENFSFTLPDVIADNTSATGFMLGRSDYKNRLDEVPFLGVIMKKNGEIVETGAPAAIFGDPLLSVVDLVRTLAVRGKGLEPGMVVLTGGITASMTFTKGDVIEILWPNETLSFRAS